MSDYRVAIIEDAGQPIGFVQTALSDEQLWARARVDGLMNQAAAAEPNFTPSLWITDKVVTSRDRIEPYQEQAPIC
jgi:hypothetical protein